MQLHGYFRSSAAYRVRIAMGLKGVRAEQISHHLRKGEQRAPDFLKLNPQGLVPALVLDSGDVLTQSLAMIEWLEETRPTPALIPGDALARARIRAFAYAIACEIHPVQNLRVLQGIKALGADEQAWAHRINEDGLKACEALIAHQPGPFCFGDQPTLADVCLVPQLANARRFQVDVSVFPRLMQAEAACNALPAFADAAPAKQHDFEP